MKKKAYLLLIILLIFCQKTWGQSWDTLPPIPYNFQGNNATLPALAEFDGSLYFTFKTPSSSGNFFKLFVFDETTWEEKNDFLLELIPSQVNRIQLESNADTALFMIIEYQTAEGQRARVQYYNGNEYVIFNDYIMQDIWGPGKNHILFHADGIIYVDDMNDNIPNDSLLAIYYDGTTKDTLFTFQRYNFHDALKCSTEDGFLLHMLGLPTPNLNGSYQLFNTASQSIMGISFPYALDFLDDISVPNGAIMTYSGGGPSAPVSPNRNVLRLTGNILSFVGDPTFEDGFENDIVWVKNRKFLAAKKSTDNQGPLLYEYNDVSYSLIDPTYFQTNYLHLYTDKDYIYAYGNNMSQMNGFPISNPIVRKKVLNSNNQVPMASNDNIVLALDTIVLRFNPRINDFDPNNDYLFTKVLSAQHGDVFVHPSYDFVYTPELGYQGLDTITYEVCDNGGLCDQAFVIVNIQGTTDLLFEAYQDSIGAVTNLDRIIDVLKNDLIDSTSLSIGLISVPTNGTATCLNNAIGYISNVGFEGLDSLDYEIYTDYNRRDTARVFISVRNNNTPPQLGNDDFTIVELNSQISYGLNDFDSQNDPMDFEIVQGPFNSNFTVTAFDTSIVELFTQSVSGFIKDSIQYKRTDFYGASSLAWIYLYENRPPKANTDFVYLSGNNTSFYPAQNDEDPDNHNLEVTILNGPYNSSSSVSICGSKCFSYDIDNWLGGQMDSIVNMINDGYGKTDTALVYFYYGNLSLEDGFEKDLNLYPNPASDMLCIETPFSVGELKILDNQGRLVETYYVKDYVIQIDISHLSPGVYMIQNSNQTVGLRFIKE